MCKNKKTIRQFLELLSVIFGLVSVVMHLHEICKDGNSEE